jgi:hypothetical protein
MKIDMPLVTPPSQNSQRAKIKPLHRMIKELNIKLEALYHIL